MSEHLPSSMDPPRERYWVMGLNMRQYSLSTKYLSYRGWMDKSSADMPSILAVSSLLAAAVSIPVTTGSPHPSFLFRCLVKILLHLRPRAESLIEIRLRSVLR